MTTIDTRPGAAHAAADDAGGASAAVSLFTRIAAWVTTTDHKQIGRLYAGFGLLALLATSALGALLGVERADDGGELLAADALLQLFQAYRVGLVFGALIPLALGLAIAVTPLQLGARSIAFPRVALTGFYAWLGGFVLMLVALGRNGGFGGGDEQAVALFLVGIGLMILGVLASAGCVATSVLTTRAPGMTMRRVPLFAWSTLVGTLGMLLALPVVFGAIVYLYIDLRYAQLNFGGVEGIADWIGWAFTVPAIAVYSLPAVGVAAELFPVAFRHRQALRGVAFTGIALVGVAALGATTQQRVHDVTFDTTAEAFVDGAVPFVIFAGLPLLGLVIVLALGALTAKQGGAPRISAAFVFALFGLLLVLAGMTGSALLGITDLELAGTSFEEGATLLVGYGSALGVLGGLVYWAPKLSGRLLPDKQLVPLALLGLVATALAGLPLCIAGFLDQPGGIPARDADVAAILAIDGVESGAVWVTLSLVGHGLMALTVLAVVGALVRGGRGEAVTDDPVGGHTIEWSTSSPAPEHNYEHVPTVTSAEPQLELVSEGSQS